MPMVLFLLILPASSPTVSTNSFSTSASPFLLHKYIHPHRDILTKYNFFSPGIAIFVHVQFVF